jgi:hypothetical protein
VANHVALQIRDRIVTLVTGLTTTGTNVEKSYAYALDRLTLPALIVRVADERIDANDSSFGSGRRIYSRLADYDVIAAAESNSDCDAALLGIAKEVETALARPATGPWSELMLIGSAHDLDGSGQKVVGKRTLTYRARYRTYENAPDAAP